MAGRRKLFSVTADKSRRRLFSDDSDSERIMSRRTVVCNDCGTAYRIPCNDKGSSTNFLCPKCGGRRFEILSNVSDPNFIKDMSVESDKLSPGGGFELSDLNKAFSDTRRKLFSDDPIRTIESDDNHYEYICRDCNTVIDSLSSSPKSVACPKCGGTRVDMVGDYDIQSGSKLNDPAANPSKDDSNDITSTENCLDKEYEIVDDLINKFRGKNVSKSEIKDYVYEKYGLEDYDTDNLIESGYIEEININPENLESESDKILKFRDTASLQNKIFSAVKLSIIKEFKIDPSMDHESLIDSLGERLSGNGVELIRCIKSTASPRVVNFSDDSYLHDSGIVNDIKAEYGGQVLGLKEFMRILEDQYPDAPDNIIELMSSEGIIELSDGRVKISK